ncbi:MAG: NPCBM/NEW2 domain-containing protein [Sedimentisphaerales bacterium]|nr:NPCBM/NEW2 domain-containing protein [Sedimentisphaerales bacterium]MBN2842515.1 NPCBM/NEW2 domain-containing protein [Sedimentisphaerales bacterium]
MSDERREYVITELLMRLLENDLDDKAIAYINDWLANEPGAAVFYWDFVKDYAAIKMHMEGQLSGAENDNLVSDAGVSDLLIASLSEAECNSPAVEKQCPLISQEPAPVVRKLSGFDKFKKMHRIYHATLSVAAVLLLMLLVYSQVFPPKYCYPAATLTEQVTAVWSDRSEIIDTDNRLFTNTEPYILENGLVKLVYEQGVEVIIEAPAEFTVDKQGLTLNYGQLYSTVNQAGQGFYIACPNARYVDLGTEFAVAVNKAGSSELHVLLGKVQMAAGLGGKSMCTRTVYEGSAMAFDNRNGKVESIALRGNDFAREIESGTKMVWRGQKSINLADIVGGGNGFGTGQIEVGIYPQTGMVVNQYYGLTDRSDSIYHLVGGNSFVDGVFVPDGGNGPVIVSSEGHENADMIDTNGTFWGCVQNGGIHYHQGELKKHSLRLSGVSYGDKDNAAILMHASQGVTFDLKKIRQSVPGLEIDKFTALCGMSETVYDQSIFISKDPLQRDSNTQPEGFFYVLVDGKTRYVSDLVCPADEPKNIEFGINDNDRFLTLIVCGSGNNAYIWSLFARPQLHFNIE